MGTWKSLRPPKKIYRLCALPVTLKGTKPTAVFFGAEKAEVKTWRAVYTAVLRRCAAGSDKLAALMELRNKISGRRRVILSDKPDGMDTPIEIAEGLYAEVYFDTDWLLRILTREILDAVHYDYSGISVAVRNERKKI